MFIRDSLQNTPRTTMLGVSLKMPRCPSRRTHAKKRLGRARMQRYGRLKRECRIYHTQHEGPCNPERKDSSKREGGGSLSFLGIWVSCGDFVRTSVDPRSSHKLYCKQRRAPGETTRMRSMQSAVRPLPCVRAWSASDV